MAQAIERKAYEYHPLCTLFPMINDEQLRELAKDIEINGLKQPIALCEGMILDGRNRQKACLKIGLWPIPTMEIAADDAVAYVISANLHRRNLSESERALMAAELAMMMEMSGKDCSTLMSIGLRSVATAKKIKRECGSHVLDAIRSRQISVNAAEKLCGLEEEFQKKLIQMPVDEWGALLITDNSKAYKAQIQTNIVLDRIYLDKIEKHMDKAGITKRSIFFRNLIVDYLDRNSEGLNNA